MSKRERDWRYDPRLQTLRDELGDWGLRSEVAGMNLRQCTKYSDPPDEDGTDRFLLEIAECEEHQARIHRELVRLRQELRQEAE